MSHAEIVDELPKLSPQERQDIFVRLCELQEHDVKTSGPSEGEKKLLDEAIEEYERDKGAGIPWREAMAQLRASTSQ